MPAYFATSALKTSAALNTGYFIKYTCLVDTVVDLPQIELILSVFSELAFGYLCYDFIFRHGHMILLQRELKPEAVNNLADNLHVGPMRQIAIILATMVLLFGCATNTKYSHLQKSLTEFVEGKDANIGIAVIIDGKDTIAVYGSKEFPMLSVYKFPIALALADEYLSTSRNFDYPRQRH